MIHAGIDGYSRCVVFVKCSNNNCATTVLNTFLEGVSVFGMPTRVRTDHCGENTEFGNTCLLLVVSNHLY